MHRCEFVMKQKSGFLFNLVESPTKSSFHLGLGHYPNTRISVLAHGNDRLVIQPRQSRDLALWVSICKRNQICLVNKHLRCLQIKSSDQASTLCVYVCVCNSKLMCQGRIRFNFE